MQPSAREYAEVNGLLATVVDRGLPLAPAFGLLAGVARAGALRDALQGVGRGLQEGQTLPDAMGRFPGVFPPDYCGLIRAGAAGDRLADVFRAAQTHHLLVARLRSKLYRLFLYMVSGIALGELALSSVLVMSDVIRKMFVDTTTQMGITDYPALNPLVMVGFTTALMISLPVGFGLLWGLYGLFQRWARFGWLGYALPAWGSIQKSRDLALFCCAVGLRLRSGTPMVEALEAGREAVANRRFRTLAAGLIARVRDGEPLSSALFYHRFFPKTLAWGVSLAEENGEVARALDSFAGLYTRQMERGFDLLNELLTPLGILTIGNVVLLAAFMILTPLFLLIRIYETLK